MKKHLLILLLLTPALAWSQTIADHWYFGEFAGLDFSGGDPMAVTDGALLTWEGASAISDEEGNLLFYTDGSKVWNREHEQMPNGINLNGNFSSTQSAIIVPRPESDRYYYIFTVDAEENDLQNGLQYSLVDMELDGGLGDVVNSEKNVEMLPLACEKVTAVKNAGDGFWVISHKYNTNSFHAYEVSASGVDVNNPVISSLGKVITGNMIDAAGYLKASPDGTKIAKANHFSQTVEIFDFDDETGLVSNAILDDDYEPKPYGIEFSPDSKVLYVTASGGLINSYLYQYDLTAGSPQEILDSRTEINFSENYWMDALQLAPDGRIYIAGTARLYLARINNPNEPGSGCDFEKDAIYLELRLAGAGLPPFIQSIFNIGADFTFIVSCFGEPTQFYENSSRTPDSVLWNFGDPASGSQNTSTLFDPTHVFSSPGFYQVSMTAYFRDTTEDVRKYVSVFELPEVNLGDDLSLCGDTSVELDAGPGMQGYVWNTGDTLQTISTDTAGFYWVEVTNQNGCSARDSIILQFYPEYFLERQTEICRGDSIFLQGEWQKQSGIYFDTLGSIHGCDSVIQTALMVRDTFNIYRDMEICEGDSVFLQGAWQSESGTYTDIYQTVFGCDSTLTTELLVSETIHAYYDFSICQGDSVYLQGGWQQQAGSYYDTNQSVAGCDSITITELLVSPVYDMQHDTAICEGDSVWLAGSWQGQAGTYNESLQSIWGCDSLISTELAVNPLPEVDLGPDTILQPGQSILLAASFPGSEYLWQNGSTAANFTADTAGLYYVVLSNDCGSASDTILISYQAPKPDCGIAFPNAFSPNRDGLNDLFKPVTNCEFSSYRLSIFSRWGQLLFETNDPHEGWEAEGAAQGTYVWVLEYAIAGRDVGIGKERGVVVVL